jgi:hypothetical protein
MKDLGVANVILNIKLTKDDNGGISCFSPTMRKISLVVLAIMAANFSQCLMIIVY